MFFPKKKKKKKEIETYNKEFEPVLMVFVEILVLAGKV